MNYVKCINVSTYDTFLFMLKFKFINKLFTQLKCSFFKCLFFIYFNVCDPQVGNFRASKIF